MNPLLILATALLISGPAYVLDGNTVVVAGMHIRLKGADASELNTERGETARQVLINIVGDSELTLPPDRGEDASPRGRLLHHGRRHRHQPADYRSGRGAQLSTVRHAVSRI